MRLHLDYETKSELSIKAVGAYKYARHPSTKIMMLGWAFDDEPEQLWQPHLGPIPERLLAGIKDSSINKHAFNAAFERLITRHCLGIEVPPEQWRCTMVESYYLGFTGGMDKVLEAVGLQKKDSRGGRLITKFCKPAPKNHKTDWYDHANSPGDWHDFCTYCRQDVRVERALWHYLQKFPTILDWDYQQWFMDQRINDRGVPMDVELANSAIAVWELEKATLTETMKDMMSLPKVTRGPFLQWIKDNTGVELESTQKDYIAFLLKKGTLPEEARPYIDLWSQKEGKATSKYTAVVNASCDEDDRARGMFQYKGAARTDRAGGRLIQLQNLKRPIYGGSAQSIDNVVRAIKLGDPDFLRMIYKEPVSEVLGGSIRHAICAGEGKSLVISDLTSIESVVIGWISNCKTIDDTFREGRDSYRVFASKYFSINYEEVSKSQRGFSKPPVLGCGFMLGWKGLIAYAEGYGVDMTEAEAKRAVDTFRSMYPEIVKFWHWIMDSVQHVTTSHHPVEGYRLRVERDAEMLRIWLPSGRALSYYQPEIRRQEAPWSKPLKPAYVNNFTYMGMDDKNRWLRISAHAGGVTENVVQSIAGDILWHGMTNAEKAGIPVVQHIHDEIVAEVDTLHAPATLAALSRCMTDQPSWCRDMWLGADGFITKRYTKD